MRRYFQAHRTLALLGLALTVSCQALAQSGTWINNVTVPPDGSSGLDRLWSDAGNWAGGVVADGSTNTATFNLSPTDSAGFYAVNVDTARTIGNLTFSDANNGTPTVWTLFGTNLLTLNNGASKPVVNSGVSGIVTLDVPNPGTNYEGARVTATLAGASGFAKEGAGVFEVAGTANTITGGINVNAGTLRFVTAVPDQAMTLANGAAVEYGVQSLVTGTVTGASATVRGNFTGSTRVGGFAGNNTGQTMNVEVLNTGTFGINRTWTGFGTFNITGVGAGARGVRLNVNDSAGTGASGNTWQNSVLNLSNVTLNTRTNSGGNDINIFQLTGDATSGLNGGDVGSVARYAIGASNVSTTFAGSIGTGTGILLNKVGTGTLTLSGPLSYTTTNNGTAANRGGVTRVTAGTLKLDGVASIQGGIVDGTLGDLYTSVDVRAGATLDVSSTSTVNTTKALQQYVGVGTILGNHNHAAGRIRAADALQGNSNLITATAGTLNFNGNLELSGGEIVYDMSLNPAAGNDLLSVSGTTTLTSGVITPNFLAGIPTSGTYTVVNSLGGFAGLPSNITVNFPGRGADPVPFVTGGSLLQFTVPTVPAGALVWRGNHPTSPTLWDIETTNNWFNNNSSSADVFFNLDAVTFDDTATGYTVALNTAVTPGTITVNNATNEYTISGTGSIGGGASLVKTGAATLNLQTANTFSGGATITGSTVNIGTFANALGTGAVTLNNGTISSAAAGGMTNSSIVASTGTSNTIIAGGTTASFGLPAVTGSGALTVQQGVAGKLVDAGNMSAYSGNLNLVGDGLAADSLVFRLNGGGNSPALAHVTLTGGASLRDRATSVQTQSIGALSGDALSDIEGYQGGSTATARTWSIGGLNLDTTFAGRIENSHGSSNSRAVTNITKVGTGTLTLSGALIHGGVTTVNAGRLLINGTHSRDMDVNQPAAPFVTGNYAVNAGGTLGGTGTIGGVGEATPVTVAVNSGGALNPGASVGTLTVNGNVAFTAGGIFDVEIDALANTADSLVVNGNLDLSGLGDLLRLSVVGGVLPEPGPFTIATYTGTLTGTFDLDNANFTIDYGTGSNSAITISNITSIDPVGIAGDYNADGVVNAADYVVWRDGDSPDSTEAGYTAWVNNFGATGAGASLDGSSVPEPAAAGLVGLLFAAAATRRRRG